MLSCSVLPDVLSDKVTRIYWILVLVVIARSDTLGQNGTPFVTTSIGLIRNLQTDDRQPTLAWYPEIQLNHTLAPNVIGFAALDASIYVGGWREFGYRYFQDNCWGGCEYESHESLIWGARLNIVLTNTQEYLSYFVGLSRHYIWSDGVRGNWNEDRQVGKFFDPHSAVEVGMRFHLPVSHHIRIGGTATVFRQLSGHRFDVRTRSAFSVAFSYVRL